jgi:DNA-binding transcriptional ArsR family regulator
MSKHMDKAFKALASGRRRQILAWLKNPVANFPPQVDGDLVRDGVCVLRIAEKLGVTQPTATQHLKMLADVGLVIPTRIGKWTFFRRDEAAIEKLKSRIAGEV